MAKQIKFEKIKMDRGFWFSAEYYEDGVLKLGEGCHSSQKDKVSQITKKFQAKVA